MSSDKPASSLGIMAHLCALYGWMSWQFWNHTAAAVIWTLGVVFLMSYFYDRAKRNG
jgi:hypothetical protein